MVSSLTNKNASGGSISEYNYTYDALGNITGISGSTNATYTYDNQGQLLTETVGSTTWTYTYDTYGNMRTASDGTTTHTYTYPDAYDETIWQDLLTSYDGNAIDYDAIGNPTTWYDGTTFTWVNGRRLASATNTAENLTASYTYDSDGLRLTKTINGVEHKYLIRLLARCTILFLFGLCFFYRLPLSEIPLIFCVPRLLAFWPIAVLLLSGIANEEATTMMAADQYSVTASII